MIPRVVAVCLLALASGKSWNVDVGPGRLFSPSTLVVALGDTVSFRFQEASHTVNSLASPGVCTFSSAYASFATGVVSQAGDRFDLAIDNTNGFSGPGSYGFGCKPHCASDSMYGVITIPGSSTTAAGGATTVPGGGAACVPKVIAVDVGPGGQRSFSPSSVVAQIGDSISFTFQSAGHTATSVSAVGSCSFSSQFSSGAATAAVGQVFTVAVTTANGFAVGASTGFGCTPHCSGGMQGVIRVVDCGALGNSTPGGNGTDPNLFAATFSPILVAHIVCMSLGFGLLMLVGVFFATFSFGAFWFPVHWVFLSSALMLILTGFVVIVVEVAQKGLSQFTPLEGSPTLGAHPTLGVILVSLVCVQVVAGIVANYWWQHKNKSGADTSRPAVVDHLHRWLGRVIVVTSIVQIFLGVREALLPDWVYGVFAAWYGLVILTVAVVVLSGPLQFRTLKRSGAATHPVEDSLVETRESAGQVELGLADL